MRNVFLLVSFFLFISCTSELDQLITVSRPAASDTKTVFYATTEGGVASSSGTKTYADSQMRVLWNEGDQISLFNKITYNQGFEFDGEDGDTAGGFYPFTQLPSFGSWGDLAYVYAVYPYSTKNKSDYDGNLTVTLPSEQSYKENSFGIGANTMVAVTETSRIQFKNVGGYLSLRLYGDNVKVSRVTIKGNNGEKIAGKAKVTIPLGGVPATVMDNTATEEVSIVCDPPVQLGADAEHYTDFWFVIPPVSFTGGFTITVTDDLGGTFVKSTSRSFTVYRNQLDWMNPLPVVTNYDNVMVPFEDANFKAYCVQNFDTNQDGEISVAEARVVTQINCSLKQIQSLSGIKYFTALWYLDCSSNQLTSLDVSHNSALVRLYCDSNQLTSLDVSANMALWYLYCSSNQLTSLNVGANLALMGLDCHSNQLASLDVSHNTALRYLRCDSNQLTNLDVSHNTALDQLYCDSNQLMGLDVSHNTALTELRCDSNQLTSLDMSANMALRYLRCDSNQLTSLDVSAKTALTDLLCYSNQLTSLDVSHNAALAHLECGSNQLTNLDVSHNTALVYLRCSSNQLTNLDVSANTALEILWCHSNQLTNLDVSHNTALIWLYCYRNQLTSLDVSHNTALTYLSCNTNQLTSLDVSGNTALTSLSCGYNQLTSLDVSANTALETLWCQSTQLTSLDVSANTALAELHCYPNPYLLEIWLKTGQSISIFTYDTNVATIYYKD